MRWFLPLYSATSGCAKRRRAALRSHSGRCAFVKSRFLCKPAARAQTAPFCPFSPRSCARPGAGRQWVRHLPPRPHDLVRQVDGETVHTKRLSKCRGVSEEACAGRTDLACAQRRSCATLGGLSIRPLPQFPHLQNRAMRVLSLWIL